MDRSLNRVEAKARLDYALLVRRTMIELSDLLNCPVEKIQARVEELIEENNSLKLQVWCQTRGAAPVTEPNLHESWKGLPSEPEPGAEVPYGPLKPAEDYGANVPENHRVGRAGTGIPVEGKFIINKLTPEIPAKKTYPPIPKRSDDSEEPNDHYAERLRLHFGVSAGEHIPERSDGFNRPLDIHDSRPGLYEVDADYIKRMLSRVQAEKPEADGLAQQPIDQRPPLPKQWDHIRSAVDGVEPSHRLSMRASEPGQCRG